MYFGYSQGTVWGIEKYSRDSLLVIPGEKLDILPGKEVQLLFIEVPMS